MEERKGGGGRLRGVTGTVLLTLGGISMAALAIGDRDPWNLHLPTYPYASVLYPAGALLTGGGLALLTMRSSHRMLRWPGLILGMLGLAVGTLWLLAYSLVPQDGRDVTQVSSSDSRHRLVVVSMSGLVDPYYEVRLRSGSGLLVRDVLVATLPQEWEQPGVRFAGPQTIEVIDDRGKVHRSTFWPTSLKVDPVYHSHDF